LRGLKADGELLDLACPAAFLGFGDAFGEVLGNRGSECDGVAGVLNELKASISALATSLDARRVSYHAARAEAAALL